MVVEGVPTTRVLFHLAEEYRVDMPITRACYNILFNQIPPIQAVEELMSRSKKHEIEEVVKDTESW
jgi:glycerol-3-phosphate dehydrogenase (NAD(P)+)